MPIDQELLKQFCSHDPTRYYLMKPFSQDGYTWATNGHIMVRVAQIDGIAPFDGKAINVARPLKGIEDAQFSSRAFTLPPAPEELDDCIKCAGRGTEHECPDCDCTCEYCKGTGRVDRESKISTTISGQIVQLAYARMVAGLPGVEVSERASEGIAPLFFRFDGGVGALMPLSCKSHDHVEIEVTPQALEKNAEPSPEHGSNDGGARG